MKTILGIDVGLYGALAFYDGTELLIYKMPTYKMGKANHIDPLRIADIIRINKPDHAYVEQVNAFGMGRTSAFNFGEGCGAIRGVLAALAIPMTFVTPQTWKKAMSCPTDKQEARARASQLLPQHKDNWPLKGDDGAAEAALIALYGFNK